MNAPVLRCTIVMASTVLGTPIIGCSQQLAPLSTAAARAPDSIRLDSTPAAGATVAAPVNSLELHFKPPVRLDEVTLSGPEGVMPAMVHAIGEVPNYSIPLSGLGPGSYTVNWRASVQGQEHRGDFAFKVK